MSQSVGEVVNNINKRFSYYDRVYAFEIQVQTKDNFDTFKSVQPLKKIGTRKTISNTASKHITLKNVYKVLRESDVTNPLHLDSLISRMEKLALRHTS